MAEKISGIYKITSKHNGKVYIGQSIDIYNRWRGHWKQVKRGDSDYIHNAMRKYGKDDFIFEIIERCPQDIINEREKYWIDFYDSYNNGYNLTIGGEGIKGKVFSEEERENMRISSMKLNKSKPVLQIDTDGNIVKEWRSCKEIGKVTDMISSNIHHCLVHDEGYHLSYGYIWMYKSEYLENGLDINLYLLNNKEVMYNKIYQIDKNGKVMKLWTSIHHILSENPTYKYSSIYSACNGQRQSMYGFKWIYEDDYINNNQSTTYKKKTEKSVNQYTYPDKEFIATYSSMHEVERLTGIGFKMVSKVCRGERKSTHGYFFEFAE